MRRNWARVGDLIHEVVLAMKHCLAAERARLPCPHLSHAHAGNAIGRTRRGRSPSFRPRWRRDSSALTCAGGVEAFPQRNKRNGETLQEKREAEQARVPLALSLIIPTLNEERSLGATLDAVARLERSPLELLIVDGGSVDETMEIARSRGARVISAERGRGLQMDAGARAARGDALWFLHADTTPPADAVELIAEALRDADVAGGNFEIRFDGTRRAARFLTWLYPQLRRLGLCYGDSAIFVRRAAYERIGGFQSYPLFEDVDLVRRLKRSGGKFVHLPCAVVTSSRRFEGRSFALTFARWMILQGLYWIGIHPRTLCRLYAPIRGAQPPEREMNSD